MKFIYYIVYVIFKSYRKYSSSDSDAYSRIIGGIAVLNVSFLVAIIVLVRPHNLQSVTKPEIVTFAVVFFLVHALVFYKKKWWLNKFAQFDTLPDRQNLRLRRLVGSIIVTYIVLFLLGIIVGIITHK
jgi:Ca2+/Na+ antiporter